MAAMPRVRVHCVHLAARFGERANGEARRMRELRAILGDIARSGRTPHLIAGDFNALAPGDTVAASAFFTRMAQLRRSGVAPNPRRLPSRTSTPASTSASHGCPGSSAHSPG